MSRKSQPPAKKLKNNLIGDFFAPRHSSATVQVTPSFTSEDTSCVDNQSVNDAMSSVTVASIPIEVGMYRGNKLNINWLIEHYHCLQMIKLGRRQGVQCKSCFDNITEVKKYAKNGSCPIADGIRADGTKELKRVVDHLLSDMHSAGERAGEANRLWLSQSDKHPWVRVLKQHNYSVVCLLLRLAVDIHNDSMTKTLSAWSWAARSLSQMHGENLVAQYSEHGLDSDFVPFAIKDPSVLLYRNPDTYQELLTIISDEQLLDVVKGIKLSDCFSLQCDKSVDKYNVDSLYVTVRYFDSDYAMRVAFLGECHSSTKGVDGLFEALTEQLKYCGMEEIAKEKMVGLTTDGENANTGKKSGLWKKMNDYLERKILTIWCIAHRSDLALDSLETSIPEIRHWKIDIKSVATYYRASSRRYEDMEAFATVKHAALRFPRHHDVRFAQHMENLCKAVINNLPMMTSHWNSVLVSGNSDGKEKAQAIGFLKSWGSTSLNRKLTNLMKDILRLFRDMQKEAQRSFVTVPDLLTTRDRIIKSLEMMSMKPYPGGEEEKYISCEETVTPAKRDIHHTTVTKSNRNYDAVRYEIVETSKNHFQQRLHVEQDIVIQSMITIAKSQNAQEMIETGRVIVADIFGEEHVSEFADNCIGFFAAQGARSFKYDESTTAQLYDILKKAPKMSMLSKLIQTFLITCPHSMQTERVISCHTELKNDLRSSLKRSTINSRLIIALNSKGTAFFDPRPCVAKFMSNKQRREKLPDSELYPNREFVKTFFSDKNNL